MSPAIVHGLQNRHVRRCSHCQRLLGQALQLQKNLVKGSDHASPPVAVLGGTPATQETRSTQKVPGQICHLGAGPLSFGLIGLTRSSNNSGRLIREMRVAGLPLLELDMVIFINGLPIITIELKNNSKDKIGFGYE
ncbi:MAG: hypothetical protein EOM08_14630, partial [Clostridia bacterium]|nr:hypothetical protein [Clostridia bacterium]